MHLNATPLRLVALLCVSLLATMAPGAHTAVPTADAATAGTAAAAAAAIPLADVLAAEGSIRTDTGINAPLDMAGWSLLSNLSAGDAPRFAKTAPAGPTTAGWNALGDNGAGDGALTGGIYTIAVSGSDVYAGGNFTDAAGIATADYLATWNGSAWSALGSNGAGNGALNSDADAIAIAGGNVYAAGYFADAAGIATADRVAIWNGSAQPQPTPGGETATPSLPPTDTGGAGTDGPGSLGQFLLLLAGLLMAVRLLTPSRALSRKS